MNKALNVIKCGMISHNLTVSQLCIEFFTKLWQNKNLKRHLYQWFTKNQSIASENEDRTLKHSGSLTDIYDTWLKIPKTNSDLEKYIT